MRAARPGGAFYQIKEELARVRLLNIRLTVFIFISMISNWFKFN